MTAAGRAAVAPCHAADRALIVSLLIAAIMGAVGAEAITYVFNEGPSVLSFNYSVPSALTWLLLYRRVINQSVPRAVAIGLLSPIVGCAVGLFWMLAGIYWAYALVRCWWITLPVAIATPLLIQLFASEFGPTYSRRPRVIALGALVAVIVVASAPAVARAWRDPFRRPEPEIASELARATPLGSPAPAVLRAFGRSILYDRARAASWGDTPEYHDGPAYRLLDRVSRVAVPVGERNIKVLLGSYFDWRGRINVFGTWVFDANDRLTDVFADKYPIRG